MGTLEKIRGKAVLLVSVVGIALFAFIIEGFLSSGSTFFKLSKNKVISVDGHSVSINDFQDQVDEMMNIYKMRSPGGQLPANAQDQIRQSVFDNLVNTQMIDNETEKIGMGVGKEELSDIIIGNNTSPIIQQMPDFINPKTGTFDKNLLIKFLQMINADDLSQYSPDQQQQIQKAKDYWLFWEHNIKEQKLQEKYATLLSRCVVANKLDAAETYDENRISVDFNYVSQALGTVPDNKVSVSDVEIRKLYEERKKSFLQEEQTVVSYIAVNINPSKTDFAAALKDMDKVKPQFAASQNPGEIVNEKSDSKYVDAYRSLAELDPTLKSFVQKAKTGSLEGPVLVGNTYRMFRLLGTEIAPDSFKISHLSIPSLNDPAKEKNLEDSLVNVINKGKSFEALAKDLTGGQTDGNMGWLTESALVSSADVKFKDEVLKAPMNVPTIIKSTYGSHLIMVKGKSHPVTKYKVADLQMSVSPSSETYNSLYNKLNAYIANHKDLSSFKAAASRAGYICQTNVNIDKNMFTLGNIENSRPALKWAFENKPGKISNIIECESQFIVVGVEKRREKGYKSYEDVSGILKRELLNKKKAAYLIAQLKAKKLNSLQAYASAMNTAPLSVKFVSFGTRNISGIGYEPVINAEAPYLSKGVLSEPLAGNNAVYVLQITDKRENPQKFDLKALEAQLESSNSYKIMYMLPTVLRQKTDVVNNRFRFY